MTDPAARLPALAELLPADRARVGGKAHHLGRMARAGLPVPPGYVVPTDLFRSELETADLLDLAEEVARTGDKGRAAELVAALAGMTPSPTFAATVAAAAGRLGGWLAVRSSGLDEDGRKRSFAGQHATFLYVRPAEVVAAVLKCWASLWSPESLAYRAGRGPAAAAMGVVVQRMVDPVTAGVLFTVNPLNGSWREMVVEATWGLGEALVSGKVTPHWYLVRRPRRTPLERLFSRVRLHIVQQDLPEIPTREVVGPDGKVRTEATPVAWRYKATLEPDQLLRLCRLGLRIERLLGEPQDVEWARDAAGGLHILQARPITTAGPPRARQDVLWTRRFVGERWPEPATPLGWSLIAPVLDFFIAYPDTQVRHLGGGPPLRLVHSRPYINATVFRHLLFKFPGAPAPRFMLELIPPEEEEEWQRRFAVKPGLGVYGSILRETWKEKRWERFRWNPFTNHKRWDEFRARMEVELPAVARTPGSEADAVRLVLAQVELLRGYCGVHVTSLLFANLWDQVLEGTLSTWLPEEGRRLRERLAVCPPGNLTLETNEAVWTLAHLATDADLERLDRGVAEGPFAADLAKFLASYGHRSNASWEIFSPRWGDHPELLAPLLRVHRSASTERPLVRARSQQEGYEQAAVELERLLSGGRLKVAKELVELTRAYLLLRENQRFWFDRLLQVLQRTLLWLGARLADRGVLDRANDVAYLTWPELTGLVEGSLPTEPVREWVARRTAQRAADALLDPPVFLRGDEGIPEETTGLRLQGLGISPGRVRGRVRLLRSPAEGGRLAPGDILVTHAVDPGWTPLFVNAGAIVLEMGSRLSHGAVVAREYGIPAVVNISGVMRRLQDGQEVTVDGTRGVVWVHP